MTQITREDVHHPDPNKRFECPLCGSARGAALRLSGDKLLAQCKTGKRCDVYGWIKAQGWLSHTAPRARDRHAVDPGEEAWDRLRRAMVILRAAHIANAGKPTDYLAARKIDVVPQGAMLMPREVSRKVLNRNFPAVVNPVMDNEGHLVGAQTILLSRDGTQRIKGKKKSYGVIAGGYIQIGRPVPNKPICVAEGWETGLAVHQITGLPTVATLGTAGMMNVNLPACSEVIIAADRGSSGQKAATILAERSVDHRITRIATPHDCSDWADALKHHHDDPDKLLELKRRIRKANKYSDKPRLRGFVVEDFAEMDFPDTEHYLEPILPAAGATVLHGPKGNGKSRLVMSISKTIALNSTLLDWKSGRVGRVLYVDGELPQRTMKLRTKRLGSTNRNMIVVSRYHQLQRGVRMGKLTSKELRDEIDHVVEEDKIDVIVLDSYSSLVGEAEDADGLKQWPAIEDWIMEHRGNGRSVLLIMHEGVQSGRARGMTKIRDQFDNIMRVEECADLNEENPDYFHFLIELTTLRDEGEEHFKPRQIARVPRLGEVIWEFVEVPERETPGRKPKNVNRDEDIYKARDEGMSFSDLAKMHNLSEDRIKKIYYRRKRQGEAA